MSEEFTVVKGKKAARHKRWAKSNSQQRYVFHGDTPPSLLTGDIGKIIGKLREELKDSTFYEDVKDVLEKACVVCSLRQSPECPGPAGDMGLVKQSQEECFVPASVVCYGLGHIASCVIAQYQLALCLLIREDMKLNANSYIYDPVFTETEKEVLRDFKFEVLQENEEGVRRADHPTLFFMPHCGKPLYNNLLWANWSKERLSNTLIIGNSFQHIVDSTPSRILKEEAEYIEKIQEYSKEWNLRNNFTHEDIFNDTSLHLFTRDILSQLPDAFWSSAPKPRYVDDVEIILNE